MTTRLEGRTQIGEDKAEEDPAQAQNLLLTPLTMPLVLHLVLLLSTTLSLDAAPRKGNSQNKAATLLRSALNTSVDPCHDFFDFSCSKFLNAQEIPPDLTSYGHFMEVREKVKREMSALLADKKKSPSSAINKVKLFYSACMDEAGLNKRRGREFLKEVEEISYWPMLHGEKWKRENYDFTELILKADKSRGVSGFLSLGATTDVKNTTRRLLQVDQGTLGLGHGSRDYYLNDKKYAKELAAYKKFIIDVVSLLAEDASIKLDKKKLEEDAEEVIEFEKKFAKIMTGEGERRDRLKMYNLRKLKDLNKLMPAFDWEKYFRGMMPADVVGYLDNADIEVIEPEFLQRLNKFIKESDPRVVTNYAVFIFYSAFGMQLGVRYENAKEAFLKVLVGTQKKSPRWKDCTQKTINKMIHANSALYIAKHFDHSSKAVAQSMINDLREAFTEMLKENDWMDATTKRAAVKKAHEMIALIGYPDFVENHTALDEYYQNLTLTPKMTFSELSQRHSQWDIERSYRRLLEPVDRKEFFTTAGEVNAYFAADQNAVVFPAAILQAPFFDKSYPKAFNYGCIGSAIGHEITHGSQFDHIGNLHVWWDPTTRRKFEQRAKCINKQYSAFEVPGTGGHHINGDITIGEDIADNGGVKESFRAYQHYLKKHGPEKPVAGFEVYSNEQLFFISYAQIWCTKTRHAAEIQNLLTDAHSPHRARVNLVSHVEKETNEQVLSNHPGFSKAFNCPSGSPMNPDKKCSVW